VAQQSGNKVSLVTAFRSIVDRAGVSGFYRGLSPALARGFGISHLHISVTRIINA
jgi:hypothetical protein